MTKKRLTTLIPALCALTSLALSTTKSLADETQPNIVFIMVDDLGYGDLGSYGQKTVKTPHLDKIAAEGMRFTQFYAGSTVCAPSRCVLMTGKNLGRAFIRGNGKDNLRPSDMTVAKLLKSAGYATGQFGKWGIGHEGSAGIPTKQGFDEFYGYLDQHHAHNFYPTFLIHNGKRVKLRNIVPNEGRFGQGVASKKVDYSHDLIMDRALKWVDSVHKKPFFLYLSLTIPHANNEAGRKGMEVPDLGPYADKNWPEPAKGFAGMIHRLDRDMGRLMARLKTHGIDNRTIVMFTSDNGPHNEGGHKAATFDSNGPLRGTKRDLYDGGIRVPMLVRWPGKIKPGTTNDHIGYSGDLMATAAHLAGVKPPADIDSISFVPTLMGYNDKQKQHKYLYWEFYEWGSAQAIRMGKWKVIRKPMMTGKIQVFDVSKDIGEKNNIANQHPEIVAKALAAMKESHVPSKRWRVPKPRKKRKK